MSSYGAVDDLEDRRPPPIAHEQALDRIARLAEDARVRNAAQVASTFGMDPVTVLEETDDLKRLVRLAAARIVQDESRKTEEAQEQRWTQRMAATNAARRR